MQDDKREAAREKSELRISVIFEQGSVSGKLVNISKGGVFLEVDREQSHRVTADDTGKTVSLQIGTANDPIVYPGSVCRYTDQGGAKYLAVTFSGVSRVLH